MDYEDFVITLGRDGEGYRRDVVSPAGEWSAPLELPFSADELARFASEKGWQPRAGAPPSASRKLGDQLFDALFAGRARQLYHESRGQVEERRHGLRLRLRIHADLPELRRLSSLPWELVRSEGSFLALSRETPVVRHPAVLQPTGRRRTLRRLRILAVMAEPGDQHSLELHREWEALEEIWRDHTSVQLDRLENPTFDQLLPALEGDGYDVLHFMGHGGFDPEQEEWVVCLLDENGETDPVKASVLGAELADFRRDLRLVVLNACYTARNLERDTAGVAMAMVAGGLTGVVAMQAIISHRAAVEFSKGLYHRLAAGDPVESALAAARKRIRRHERTGPVWPAEWATPVLFLRTDHGELFEVPPENAGAVEPESWQPSGAGLSALASGGLGLALLAGLASLWVWEPAPLRSALTVVLIALGGVGWLGKQLWTLYQSKDLTRDLSRMVADRRGLSGALFALPLLALGGWGSFGAARVEQLRCLPLDSPASPFTEAPRRIVVEPWTTPAGASREETNWALETTERWQDVLRATNAFQVLEKRPAKLPASCIDVTISGQIRRNADQDVVLRATLSDPSQQGTSFERIDRPDDFGGIEHLQAGLLPEVLEALDVELTSEERTGLAAPPSSPQSRQLNRWGVLALLEGNIEEAERRLLGALELDPDYATAHNNLGRVLLRREQPEAAIARFRRAVELRPEHALYHYNLALAFERQATWRRAGGDAPDRYRPLLEEAVLAYGKVLELDRNHARASNNLGFTLLELGDLELARETLERAYRLAGDDLVPFAEKNLGRLALADGRPEDALKRLEAATTRDPGLTKEAYAEALYFLAAARDDLARERKAASTAACDAWREYLEIASDDPELQRRRDAVKRVSELCGD